MWLNKQYLKTKPRLVSSDYINRAESKTRSVSIVHFNMLQWGSQYRPPDQKVRCWASNAWQEILDDSLGTSRSSRRCRYSWRGTTGSTVRLDWRPHRGGDKGTTRYKLSIRVRESMEWSCLIHDSCQILAKFFFWSTRENEFLDLSNLPLKRWNISKSVYWNVSNVWSCIISDLFACLSFG